MNRYAKLFVRSESMKTNELRSEGMDTIPAIENGFLHASQPIVEGKAGTAENTASNDEREAKIEELMRNVKAFIRNIDVNSL